MSNSEIEMHLFLLSLLLCFCAKASIITVTSTIYIGGMCPYQYSARTLTACTTITIPDRLYDQTLISSRVSQWISIQTSYSPSTVYLNQRMSQGQIYANNTLLSSLVSASVWSIPTNNQITSSSYITTSNPSSSAT